MKILYRDGVAAKCDDRQVATMLASGWSYHNAPKEIPAPAPVQEQVPVKKVVQPQTRVQPRVLAKPTTQAQTSVKKDV